MVKLDFEEYDEISKMELIIESIIRNFRLEQVLISLANDEKQKIMILTILSILCKQKYYQEYLKKHVIQYQQDDVIQVIEEVINKLKESLETNDIKEATYKLKEHGEMIIDTGWHYVWGRGCSGQAILLDWVVGKIAEEMGILEGMEHDWSKYM